MGVNEVCSPFEVLGLDVHCRERELNSGRSHGCHVTELYYLSSDTLSGYRADEVIVVAFVPVSFDVDAVVKESESKSEVELMFLLISEGGIFEVIHIKRRFLVACTWPPRCLAVDYHT